MIDPSWAIFEHYPSDIRPISPVVPLGNAGGLSGAGLYRFRAGRGDLVARRWPANRPHPEHLDQIHTWLAKAGDLGFVPVPLRTLDGRSWVDEGGNAWEIAPWMPGTADPSRPPSPARLRLAFGALGAFLNRLAQGRSEGPSTGLAHRVSEIERLIHGGFAAITALLEGSPTDPASPLARHWLDRAFVLSPSVLKSTRVAASLPLPLQPCLRDARAEHFLFEGDRLSGLVDFGAMRVDSVAGDLARLLEEAVGPDRSARGEALAAFEAIRPLSDAESRAMGAFEKANALLEPFAWISWHFIDGRTFEQPDAVVKGLAKCLGRLDEVL
jgi:Ser/Thr protein kinase RdoA (MazF antagonist)